jgi:hypothetical protein
MVFKFDPENDDVTLELTASQVLDILKEAEVDSSRLSVLEKWLKFTAKVGQWYSTPYGKLVRVK